MQWIFGNICLLYTSEKLWEVDQITDAVVDNLIVNTADSSDDSSSDMEGIELLSDSNW